MCGIVGIIGGKPVSRLIYHSLFSIQHRCQSSAGKLTYDGNIHVTKDAGLVREVFYEESKIDVPGILGLGHTRYSTAGMDDIKSLKRNAQPEYIINPFLSAVQNGNIYNCTDILITVVDTPTFINVLGLDVPVALTVTSPPLLLRIS